MFHVCASGKTPPKVQVRERLWPGALAERFTLAAQAGSEERRFVFAFCSTAKNARNGTLWKSSVELQLRP
jgi:hypothetical protein